MRPGKRRSATRVEREGLKTIRHTRAEIPERAERNRRGPAADRKIAVPCECGSVGVHELENRIEREIERAVFSRGPRDDKGVGVEPKEGGQSPANLRSGIGRTGRIAMTADDAKLARIRNVDSAVAERVPQCQRRHV